MSKVEGGVGAGRVLVFQPATPVANGLPVALGIQRFWQKTLKEAGRPAAAFTMRTRIEAIEGTPPDGMPIAVGDRGIANVGNWADPTTNAVLVRQQESRWGLIATLAAGHTDAKLETELIDVEDTAAGPGARSLAKWSYEGSFAGLPDHVCDVLVETSRRVGTKLEWTRATEAFDTDDAGAAMFLLEAMGYLSMAEDDVRLMISNVLDRVATLAAAAPRSARVIALVPELFGHLSRLGAHDLQLAGWLRRVRTAIGDLPTPWTTILDDIARRRATE